MQAKSDESIERLYDHLHTDGTGRSGTGRTRDRRAVIERFSFFTAYTHCSQNCAICITALFGRARDGKKMNTQDFSVLHCRFEHDCHCGLELESNHFMSWR
jgi:hypothetical protein